MTCESGRVGDKLRLWAGVVVAALFVVGGVVVSAAPAAACSCLPPETTYEAGAHVVFAGTARKSSVESGGLALTWFDVDEVHKGSAYARQAVLTDAVTSCSVGFDAGTEYLVFAGPPTAKLFQTGRTVRGAVPVFGCQGTTELSSAGQNQDRDLYALAQPGSGEMLSGASIDSSSPAGLRNAVGTGRRLGHYLDEILLWLLAGFALAVAVAALSGPCNRGAASPRRR